MTKNNTWNFDTTFAVGDLLYASSSSVLSKLAIGAENDVLTVSSGLPIWQEANSNTIDTKIVFYYEDFIGGTPGAFGTNSAQNGVLGTASRVTLIADSGHPGDYSISTGTSSSGVALVSSGINLGANQFLFGGGSYDLIFYAKIPTLSTGTQRFKVQLGYLNADPATAGTITNGAWFEYIDNVNSGNWVIKTMKASTTSTGNSSTAADTNWHKFQISVNAGATSVAFYIDDNQLANSPLTTNIPNATGNEVGIGFLITKSVGSTARTVEVDWYQHLIQLTSQRF